MTSPKKEGSGSSPTQKRQRRYHSLRIGAESRELSEGEKETDVHSTLDLEGNLQTAHSREEHWVILDGARGVPSSQGTIFAELKSAVGNELSKAGLVLFTQLDQGGSA
jgi:hypothetical protein